MGFCGECGTPSRGVGSFCHECGAPAGTAAASAPAAAVAVDPARVGTEVVAQGGPSAPLVPEAPDPGGAAWLLGPAAPPQWRPAGARSPGSWLRGRRLRIAAHALLLLGLLGAGVTIGWLVGADQSLVEADAARPATPAVQRGDAVPVGSTSMPDLRGLTVAQAQQVLADLGIAPGEVSLVDQRAAGEPGIVLTQVPVYGYPVEDGVELSIARPAEVPAFRGRDVVAVLADLDELGAAVETVSRYVAGAVEGSVVEIDPAPGAALPDEVTVVVAAAAGEVALADFPAVDDSCYTTEESMNGDPYAVLLTCEADRSAVTHSWVVGRAGSRLTGVLGVPDSEDPGTTMQLEVLGDGRQLAVFEAAYGTTQRVEVDVTGVLRLTLRYRAPGADYGVLGLGRLRLEGDETVLRRLEGTQ